MGHRRVSRLRSDQSASTDRRHFHHTTGDLAYRLILLSTDIKLLWTSFDLVTDRLMPSVTDRLLIMYDILLQHLLLCYSSCVHSILDFIYGRCEHPLVTELNNEYFTRQMFFLKFF